MSIESHRCYVLVCDLCACHYNENHEGYIVHFDTPDQALDGLSAEGWTVTESGIISCPPCTARRDCAATGHDLSPWFPCYCKGAIPDHAVQGCGLFRFCQRHGCDHIDNVDLNTLPVTEEPTYPGR